MSTVHWIQTTLEVVAIALIILGIIYEPLLVKWEEKAKGKVLRAFKEKRKYRK